MKTRCRCGYSDFFASGLPTMTTPGSRSSIFFPSMSSSSSKPSVSSPLTKNTRHRRVMSMTFPSSQQTQKRQHRNSLVDFSFRLIDKMGGSSSEEPTPFGTLNETRRKLTKKPPHRLSKIHIITDHVDTDPIDPFASSPDSKSFFIDLTKRPSVMDDRRTKRNSFLFMSPQDREESSSMFNLKFPFLNRPRPSSVHTMPLPEMPTRSSFNGTRSSRSARSDRSSWISTDEVASMRSRSPMTPPPIQEEEEEEGGEWNDPANIDWRQFHIEFL